jgi:hypothetical protein
MMNCEIRSGTNGVFNCTRPAVGTWQFGSEGEPFGERVLVCKLHANRFTKQGFWNPRVAFKPCVNNKQEVR